MTDSDSGSASDAAKVAEDMILPFQLDALDVRGRLARLDGAIDVILRQHAYPEVVSGLLAEAALITALVGASMKLKGRLSIQVRGEGPLRLIATDYFAPETDGAPARLRAYAGFDRPLTQGMIDDNAAPMTLFGKGVFGLLLDYGQGRPYQGVTPLIPEGLTKCAEVYFAQSEQIATRFALASARVSQPGQAENWRAGGVMIQHMPTGDGATRDAPAGDNPKADKNAEPRVMDADDAAALSDREDDWTAAAAKLATVEPHELIGPTVTPEGLLLRLYHEDAPRVYPAAPVSFGCTCSAERVEQAIKQYAENLDDMRDENGLVSVDCQFCGRAYAVDPNTGVASLKQS